uniref:Uncharacterized protein n=1 Tax=Biomphalaria glabrata TaxID=6526 RepID=A0A2C9L2K4_BIOGL
QCLPAGGHEPCVCWMSSSSNYTCTSNKVNQLEATSPVFAGCLVVLIIPALLTSYRYFRQASHMEHPPPMEEVEGTAQEYMAMLNWTKLVKKIARKQNLETNNNNNNNTNNNSNTSDSSNSKKSSKSQKKKKTEEDSDSSDCGLDQNSSDEPMSSENTSYLSTPESRYSSSMRSFDVTSQSSKCTT